jgi:dephospho-CoA kinase
MIESWAHSLDAPVAVVEAALLAETGSWRAYHVLMVVWCEPAQQIERALTRGIPEERAKGLVAAQLPIDEKIQIADVVVDNRGSVDVLIAEVDRAWSDVLRICGERICEIDVEIPDS